MENVASSSELTCIDDLLGDELPDDLLDITVTEPEGVIWPVVGKELLGIEISDSQWPHELWRCLSPETATAAYLSVFAHQLQLADLRVGPEEHACISQLVSEARLSEAVSRVLTSEKTFPDENLGEFMDQLDELAAELTTPCFLADETSADATSAPEVTDESPPAGSESMGPAEVYEMVSPSIPFIETASGTGSGVLIEGGYVVTNFHVVWPYEAVWVVFPDGTEFEGVPVLAFDYIADLAVLAPVAHDAAPLRLADGEDMAPGSELFLIGYPAEYEVFPDPTITQGILSRLRQWDTYDLTLLQTDAAITGGQSGGALLNNRGEVVGISTWGFSGAGFGVATSAVDVEAIVSELIEDHEASGYQSGREVSNEAGELTHHVTGVFGTAFTFEGAAGTVVSISIDGEADGIIRISDATGILLEADDTETGEETATAELLQDGIHFVEVENYLSDIDSFLRGYEFDLASSVRLLPYEDPDDDSRLADSAEFDIAFGLIDSYSDVDFYSIELEAGETIRVYTDSITADTALAVLDGQTGELLYDDDSGPISVLDNPYNAQLEFTAPTAGDHYYILVEDVLGERGNGYALIVERIG